MFLNNSFSQTLKQEQGYQMSLRSSILQESQHQSSLLNIQQNSRPQKLTDSINRPQKNSSNQILRKKDKKAQDKENQSKSYHNSNPIF